MTAVQFYHLTATPLERALPKLLEKAVSSRLRVVLTTDTAEKLEKLDQLLWSYDAASFLPHGVDNDGTSNEHPILVSTGTQRPNLATLLIVTDGKWPNNVEEYERVLDIFDGNDVLAVESARTRFSSYKKQGFPITYLRQNAAGGWDK